MTLENERQNNTPEQKPSVESVFEQAKGLSQEEMLELMKKMVVQIEAKIQEASTTTESQKNQIESLGGSDAEIAQRTEEKDEEIKAVGEDVKQEIQQIAQIETSTIENSNANNIEKDEKNYDLNQQFTEYHDYDKKIGYFRDGQIIEDSTRIFFSRNSETGQVLPSEKGIEFAKTKHPNYLKEAFDFDSQALKKASVNQLNFKPAITDESGKIIQKGEIILSDRESVDTTFNNESKKIEDNLSNQNPEILKDTIPYVEFNTKFGYFDEGEKTNFSNSGDLLFSYNSLETGEVLPLQEGWDLIKTNSSFYLNKSFTVNSFDVFQIPLNQLRFKPAKVSKDGRIVEKGEILKI